MSGKRKVKSSKTLISYYGQCYKSARMGHFKCNKQFCSIFALNKPLLCIFVSVGFIGMFLSYYLNFREIVISFKNSFIASTTTWCLISTLTDHPTNWARSFHSWPNVLNGSIHLIIFAFLKGDMLCYISITFNLIRHQSCLVFDENGFKPILITLFCKTIPAYAFRSATSLSGRRAP